MVLSACDAIRAAAASARFPYYLTSHYRFYALESPCIGKRRAIQKFMKQKSNPGTQTYPIVSTGENAERQDSAGQSGDTQGLSNVAGAGAESVEELLEEGQSFEAEAIGGVENAPDADVAEVHTRHFPEDDVPAEYLGKDQAAG